MKSILKSIQAWANKPTDLSWLSEVYARIAREDFEQEVYNEIYKRKVKVEADRRTEI